MKTTLILAHLLQTEAYLRKIIPHLSGKFFESTAEKKLFDLIADYTNKYNQAPSKGALLVLLEDQTNINEELVKDMANLVDEVFESVKPEEIGWMVDTTEKWVQERALVLAIHDSIHILNGEDKTRDRGAIPKLVQEALAVSFDRNIGHDYMENDKDRFEYYHTDLLRIPFELDALNKMTDDGFPKKTLNLFMAPPNVGKSLVMCACAAGALAANYNVLYITLEMSQDEIAKRIDANLLNVNINELQNLTDSEYFKKTRKLKESIKGRLVVKEYPTAGASTTHFRALLNELVLKKEFVPDIIFVDYVNIMVSARIKMGNSVNSYTFVKAITEELRGLAIEYNVAICSATQTGRAGAKSSDPTMEDVSESYGTMMTCDWAVAIVKDDDIGADKFVLVKLRHRYGDATKNKRFIVKVDRNKMRLEDDSEYMQSQISDTGQSPQQQPTMPFSGTTKPKLQGIKV